MGPRLRRDWQAERSASGTRLVPFSWEREWWREGGWGISFILICSFLINTIYDEARRDLQTGSGSEEANFGARENRVILG